MASLCLRRKLLLTVKLNRNPKWTMKLSKFKIEMR